ncbi:hypothetical protein [Ramlibacter sp.]|uniref:hypothetical protein n=1 Tax=Ramlibacter sp. TaxID=1917967 RepID=UPI003D0A2C66
MSWAKPNSLLDYLGAEHTNELVGVHRYGRHLQMLAHIDGFLRAPVPHLELPAKKHAIAQLYMFVNYSLYAVAANLLRLHVSEAMGCERRAIDATFAAYEMILDPESVEEYEKGEARFLFIKNRIQKARNKDENLYPLAKELLKTHDHCSAYGAHADMKSMQMRMKHVKMQVVENKHNVFFLYFEEPQSEADANLFYVDTFLNFLNMAKVFAPFVQEHAKGFDFKAWSERLASLDLDCRKVWAGVAKKVDEEYEQLLQQEQQQ